MSEKRKMVIVSGKHKHEIEIGGDVKRLTIFKLGDKERGWTPDKQDLEHFRKLLSKWSKDPEFMIITHYALEVEQIDL